MRRTLKELEIELKKHGFRKVEDWGTEYFEKIKDKHLVYVAYPENKEWYVELRDDTDGSPYEAIPLKGFNNQSSFIKSFLKAKLTY
jgi:hypothetical protein